MVVQCIQNVCIRLLGQLLLGKTQVGTVNGQPLGRVSSPVLVYNRWAIQFYILVSYSFHLKIKTAMQ